MVCIVFEFIIYLELVGKKINDLVFLVFGLVKYILWKIYDYVKYEV